MYVLLNPPLVGYADGLGMLVHQAARAVELALGEAPPLSPLFKAVRRG